MSERPIAAAVAVLAVVLAACSGTPGAPSASVTAASTANQSSASVTSPAASNGTPSAGSTVVVAITNDGCQPNPATVAAGHVTFDVSNVGADKVSEIELEQNGNVVGEKENLAPGLSGSFSVDLAAGEYTIVCPGAATSNATLHVG